MKFFRTPLIRELDQYTIEHEPITSICLMERAADALYHEILKHLNYNHTVYVLAGPGNNGGDALELARMLLLTGVRVRVILLHGGKLSADCEANRLRLLEKFPTALTEQRDLFQAPDIETEAVIIDGLFGSGLSRPLTGIFADAVSWINSCENKVFAIDIPSGLQGEENDDLEIPIVRADMTLSLQFPKLAFLLPDNARFVGEWHVLDIGIHSEAIKQTNSNLYYLENSDIAQILKKRPRFSHKGTFGHALIVAGSGGMAGAAVLATKAALRSGAGLVTVRSVAANRLVLQTTVPEAIFQQDVETDFLTYMPDVEHYDAIAIGPGIGTHQKTAEMLERFLRTATKPCVLDADALNIVGMHNDLLTLIPQNSVLTPHPKEFERMFGVCRNSYERMNKALEVAQQSGVIIVLKGAHTLIATPDGKLFFNSTGNSGMATGGSGDVLTGILAGLLAQGYLPEDTAKLGVFLHGRAGDFALNCQTEESLIAGDIIEQLGNAFRSVKGAS